MKKILLTGLILVSCLFCINVNAEEKYLNFEDEQKDMVYFAEEPVTYIGVDTNMDSLSGDKLYYSIDGGEFVEDEANTITLQTEDLLNKAEHSITIYGETSEGTKTEEKTIDFLIVNKEKSFESAEFGFNLTVTWVPINTTMSVEKVTDSNIIKLIKLQDPYVLKARLATEAEDMMYYFEKYNGSMQVYVHDIQINASSYGLDDTCVNNESKSYNEVKSYLINSSYQIIDSFLAENCNLEYVMSFAGMDEKNTLDVFLNGYLAFAKGELIIDNYKDDVTPTPEVKDETVESPKTGIEDYALFILGGLALAVTSITILNRNKKFKRI